MNLLTPFFHSAAFHSFGSLFAIPTSTHIQVLLATLVELKIRFIFARGVCSDEIIAEVQRQCLASGNRGLLATWIPQNGQSPPLNSLLPRTLSR